MSDLLTWLNAEHLAAQQTYQAQRDPYHEGAVDALDRVIARVEKQAPPDLTPLRTLAETWRNVLRTATYVEWNDIDDCAEDAAFETLKSCANELTRALDALEGKS